MHLLHAQFFENAKGTPDALAIGIGEDVMAYGELADMALKASSAFYKAGVGRNDRVCIIGEKTFETYAAILGALRVGASYIPVEPSYPLDRMQMILDDAEPEIVLACGGEAQFSDISIPFSAFISEMTSDDVLAVDTIEQPVPTDIAYILFTSGSTGRPKGVMVNHHNAYSFVEWGAEYFSATSADRFSGHSDLTFDLSVFDTFVAFFVGASLFPVTEFMDKTSPGDFIKRNEISIWFSVPSVVSGMSSLGAVTPENLACLRWMAFCGEALRPGIVSAIRNAAPDLRIANLYGPTEATVACSAYEVSIPFAAHEFGVSIGRRTKGTEIFIWNEGGRLAEVGETGEVYIAGDQICPGYFKNEEQTAERFVPDPRFPHINSKCFKTGDLAIETADGPYYKSRMDNMVKFRGYRIELGDVEQGLAKIPGVGECAATLITGQNGEDRFYAFVKATQDMKANDVKKQLNAILPTYMVPTHIRIVDDFPRTLNKKIDRKRLAEIVYPELKASP